MHQINKATAVDIIPDVAASWQIKSVQMMSISNKHSDTAKSRLIPADIDKLIKDIH